ncbi:MAG: hypothetical protein ACI82S_003467, partial [Patiriisocius sp.]
SVIILFLIPALVMIREDMRPKTKGIETMSESG